MSEPERPIERLLRESAKERRGHAGDGWELHPVNRRQLQKEVERKFGSQKGQRTGWFSRFAAIGWTSAIGATVAIAVLITAIWLILPASKPSQDRVLLARNQPENGRKDLALDDKLKASGSTELQEREGLRQSPVGQTEVSKKELEMDRAKRGLADNELKVAPAPSVAQTIPLTGQPESLAPKEASSSMTTPTVNAPPVEELASVAFQKRYGFSKGPAPQPAASAANVSSETPVPSNLRMTPESQTLASAGALSDQSTGLDAGRSVASGSFNFLTNTTAQLGYFSNVEILGRRAMGLQQRKQGSPASAAKTATAAKLSAARVLTYFRVEQSGDELRVIDSDNSIYVGRIKPATAPGTVPALNVNEQGAAQASALPAQADAAKPFSLKATQQAELASSQGYVFQVVGTNLSSKQRVVFSGILSPGSGMTAAPRFGGVAAQGGSSGGRQQIPAETASPRYISGTALVGSSQQIDIEAAPVLSQTPSR